MDTLVVFLYLLGKYPDASAADIEHGHGRDPEEIALIKRSAKDVVETMLLCHHSEMSVSKVVILERPWTAGKNIGAVESLKFHVEYANPDGLHGSMDVALVAKKGEVYSQVISDTKKPDSSKCELR